MSNFEKAVIGLEIFSVGTHTDSQGFTNEFSDDDVDYMVGVFGGGFPEFVPIKLGHTSDEFNRQVAAELGLPASSLNGEDGEGLDGVAALGQVVNLYAEGNKLVADLKVPDAMAQLFADGYFRDVSCELSKDSEDRWILDGLAMLGAERPAVDDLAGIAAAAVHKKRAAVAVHSFSQPVKKVQMSKEDKTAEGMLSSILGKFKSEDESLSFTDLRDLGLKLGEESDKGAVKDAVRELQERSSKLDDVMALLQQAMEVVADAAEDHDAMTEDEIAAEPAVAAKALVDGITSIIGSKSSGFKAGSSEFKSAVATAVKNATKELTAQVAALSGDSIVARYRVETEKLVGMEGTPADLAKQLADLEAKTDVATAKSMLSAWQTTSKIAIESGQFKAVGAGVNPDEQQGEPSELEKEAAEFKKENPTFSDGQALAAVRLRRMNAVREAK